MVKPIPAHLLHLPGWSQHTPFQQAVLAAVYSIPKGEVRTYQQVARIIGRPKAVRAVGTALSKNPYAPLVPCHRVVKSDGTLGNYSGKGGKAGKKKMLQKEGAIER
ncbi:Methylated-DNA--protein-cysteine methyltransferase [uncultured archaeon]|nr:Methylated-DNA--protein-cysteine methyltransferase [uncultured archaeon]